MLFISIFITPNKKWFVSLSPLFGWRTKAMPIQTDLHKWSAENISLSITSHKCSHTFCWFEVVHSQPGYCMVWVLRPVCTCLHRKKQRNWPEPSQSKQRQSQECMPDSRAGHWVLWEKGSAWQPPRVSSLTCTHAWWHSVSGDHLWVLTEHDAGQMTSELSVDLSQPPHSEESLRTSPSPLSQSHSGEMVKAWAVHTQVQCSQETLNLIHTSGKSWHARR